MTFYPPPVAIPGLDSSAMPAAHLLATVVPGHGGFVTPTDANSARDCVPLGIWDGSVLRTDPSLVLFSADGGDPRPGALAYVAPGHQDSGTAYGKASATPPRRGRFVDFAFAGRYEAQAVPIGVVLSFDSGTRLGLVRFQPHAPRSLPEPDRLEIVQGVTTPTNNDKITAAGTTPATTLNDGESIVVWWFNTQHTAGDDLFVANTDTVVAPTKGYWIYQASVSDPKGVFVALFGTGGDQFNEVAFLNCGYASRGLNKLVVVREGGKVRALLNAGNDAILANGIQNPGMVSATITGVAVAPDAGCTFAIFSATAGQVAGGVRSCKDAAGLLVAHFPYALTRQQMYELSDVFPRPGTRRFRLPERYRTLEVQSPSQQPSAKARDGYDWVYGFAGISDAGMAATDGPRNFTLTLAGSPLGVNVTGEQFYSGASLLPYVIDSLPPVLDQDGGIRASPFSRIRFTTPTYNSDVAGLFAGSDPGDEDNDSLSVWVDGAPHETLGYVLGAPPGDEHWYWSRLTLNDLVPASHVVDIVSSVTFQAGLSVAGNDSATEAFGGELRGLVAGPEFLWNQAEPPMAFTHPTPSLNKRLVIVGLDDIEVGHDQFPPNHSIAPGLIAPALLVRQQFPVAGGPGGVSVYGAIAQSIANHSNQPGGLARWVRDLVLLGGEGGAATVRVLFAIGLYDYLSPVAPILTPVQFGAAYGQILDLLHAAKPGWSLFVRRTMHAFFDATANGQGHTFAEYDAQIVALATGRSWLTVLQLRDGGITFRAPNFRVLNLAADNVNYAAKIMAAVGG